MSLIFILYTLFYHLILNIGVIGKGQKKAGKYTAPLCLSLHLFCPVVGFS